MANEYQLDYTAEQINDRLGKAGSAILCTEQSFTETQKERARTNIGITGTGADGKDGQDGTSVTHSWNGTVLTITSASGTSSADLKGEKGDQGIQGDKGDPGSDASVTSENIASALGYTPANQAVVSQMAEQKANKQGLSLGVGDDGLVYLFVDGVAQGNGLDIKADAVAGDVVGYVDSDNTIIITGALADGVYTLKYEDGEGKTTDIGSLEIGGASYTNQLPVSTDESGAIYNGTGYKTGYRLGSSSTESEVTGTNPTFITGFIPVADGQTVRLKNCYIDTDGINGFNSAETTAYYGKAANSLYISLYNSSKGALNAVYWSNLEGSGYFTDLNTDGEGKVTEFKINRSGIAYIRLTLAGDAPNAIITVDQPITD